MGLIEYAIAFFTASSVQKVYTCTCPTRGSSFFLGKVTTLGVLCCFALFVCLTLLASFFLPSHLSFKNMYNVMYMATLNNTDMLHVSQYLKVEVL